MSNPDFAKMSTDDLIREFADTARQTPIWLWNMSQEFPKRTPERNLAAQKLQAMGEELRARKPIAELRRLFEDENRGVRGWAGA